MKEIEVTKKRLIHKILRPIINFISDFSGYGGCLACGDTWNWKKPHDIPYTESKAAFPVCEECWLNATDKEILDATQKLSAKRTDSSHRSIEPYEYEEAAMMVRAVERAVSNRKHAVKEDKHNE